MVKILVLGISFFIIVESQNQSSALLACSHQELHIGQEAFMNALT